MITVPELKGSLWSIAFSLCASIPNSSRTKVETMRLLFPSVHYRAKGRFFCWKSCAERDSRSVVLCEREVTAVILILTPVAVSPFHSIGSCFHRNIFLHQYLQAPQLFSLRHLIH